MNYYQEQNDDKIRPLTTYLAGYIETRPVSCSDWRDQVIKGLYSPEKLLIYNPLYFESFKTGKDAPTHIKMVQDLKSSIKFDEGGSPIQTPELKSYLKEMDKVWWGEIDPGILKWDIIKQFYITGKIQGNRPRDLYFWGDYEAVARSTFIIVYYKRLVPTWGTPWEVQVANFLNIPIYIIMDGEFPAGNSSLGAAVLDNPEGRVFFNTTDCIKTIKKLYNL